MNTQTKTFRFDRPNTQPLAPLASPQRGFEVPKFTTTMIIDPHITNETDLLLFFQSKCDELQLQFPTLRDISLMPGHGQHISIHGYQGEGYGNAAIGSGRNLEEATADLRTKVKELPDIIAEKRAQAARLLEEADALSSPPVTLEPDAVTEEF